MKGIIGPFVLGIGTVLVSSMFAVLKSLENIHPIVRASWRLQTTFLALAAPSALSLYLDTTYSINWNQKGARRRALTYVPPVSTIWSGIGYALYNVGLCIALAKTSLLRASTLSQCAPLFIVLHKMLQHRNRSSDDTQNGVDGRKGVYWKHLLGVVLTLVGTGMYISSTATETSDKSYIGTVADSSKAGGVNAKGFNLGSHLIGDVAAIAASAGYAIYISCGRQARQVVPVYIHLPICVFVAMVIVCTVGLGTVGIPEVVSSDFPGMRENHRDAFFGKQNAIVGFDATTVNATSYDFCSNLVGWTCAQYLPRSAFLGIVCGAIAVGMINWSLNHVSALQAATANSAEPIAASIIGIIFFAEAIPNFVAIVAAGIIVIAMMLCSADDGTDSKSKSSENDIIAGSTDCGTITKKPMQILFRTQTWAVSETW